MKKESIIGKILEERRREIFIQIWSLSQRKLIYYYYYQYIYLNLIIIMERRTKKGIDIAQQ